MAFITVVVGLLLLGAIVSLPVFLVPKRRQLEERPSARIATAGALALFSLAVSFGLVTRFTAMAAYTFTTLEPGNLLFDIYPFTDYEANKNAIIQELWIRQAIPPFLEAECNHPEEKICRLTNNIVMVTESLWSRETYGRNLRIGMIPTAVTGLLVWVFTRRKKGTRPKG